MKYFIIVDGTVEDTADSESDAKEIVISKILIGEDPEDIEVGVKVPLLINPNKAEIRFGSMFTE